MTRPLTTADGLTPSLPRRRQPLVGSAASRTMLLELIAYLNQRQSATRAQVTEHTRAAETQATAVEARAAHTLDRLQAIEDQLHQGTARVATVQAVTELLRQPPAHSKPAEPTPLRPTAARQTPSVRPTDAPTLLKVEKLSKEIGGSDILLDISFEIHEHEILGLIGPNGAGKTTLIECLANLRPRTSGVFYERDEAPASWDPSQLLFYLPNSVAPYAELYTIEVLTLFGRLFEVEPRRWEQIIIDDLSLGPALQKKVAALSKGNLQRLLIALALMSPQPLLALDEPFDGLDLHQTHAMMDILRRLRGSGRTLLLCIHQLSDAERICDRLLLLSGGRLVAIGTLDELREQAGLPGASLEEVFLSLTTK